MDTKEKKKAAPRSRAAVDPRKKSRRPASGNGTRASRTPDTAKSSSRRKPVGGAAPARRRAASVTSEKRKINHAARRKVEPARKRPTPDVVYTPAKPFSRSRLLLQLASIVAVVLALTFGLSIFFKVEKVMVYGAKKYDAWTVKDASGIQEGDNLLSFGKIKAVSKIQAELHYVDDVRIGIKLPDTVNIVIEELDAAYAILDGANRWWLITAEGKAIEMVDSTVAESYTKVTGVQIADPVPGQQISGWEHQPDPTDPTAEAVVISVSAQERLNTALSILQYLEDNSVMGLVASVDVEDLADIELWYGQQYQVRLGDSSQLSYKIRCMCEAVAQLKEYDTGLLDISFMLIQDQVIYEPFLE